jgi:predicted RNA-binding Zn-ribbon protein involved in translation (DUF1610 family)
MDSEHGRGIVDEGLRCLSCDYNLTGLTSGRCPECGEVVNWSAVRAARDGEDHRPGTCWERWRWYLKPAGFAVTAVQAAVVPWILARQIRQRPNPGLSLVFIAVCLAAFLRPWHFSWDGSMCAFLMGIGCQIVLETILFWALLPLVRVGRSWRFWLAVAAYTSYPLAVEGVLDFPPPVVFLGDSNVWPFPDGQLGHDPGTSVLFHLWWVGLAVIMLVRVQRSFRWRIPVAVLAIPVLTSVAGYTGCFLGEIVCGGW